MRAKEILECHEGLTKRLNASTERLSLLSKEMQDLLKSKEHQGICAYAAGSLGRLESGPASDLDLFLITNKSKLARLEEVRLLASVADINDHLKFPPLSPDMRFFRIYDRNELIDHTGKPIDDTENSFTARMLLLLESYPVAGEIVFEEIAKSVAHNYFRDNKGKKDFRPLFLLNDLLRYWRTLCLNYEGTRSDPEKSWRKKNMNLRFCRLATVFSTVVALLALRPRNVDEFLPLVRQRPFLRLANAIDHSELTDARASFASFLDNYEWFLQLKDERGAEKILSDRSVKLEARRRAEDISKFFQNALSSQPLSDNAQYLII